MAPWVPQVPFILVLRGNVRSNDVPGPLSKTAPPSEYHVLELVACVIVPAFLLGVGGAVFVLRRIPWPSPIHRLLRVVFAHNPFRPFLTLEEVEALEASGDDARGTNTIENPCGRAAWKRRALAAGSALAMVVSLGSLAFAVAAGQAHTLHGAEVIVGLALWVSLPRQSLRVSLPDVPSSRPLSLCECP